MYEARRAYKIARAQQAPWPEEFEHYMINKKLVSVDLNWGRLQRFKGNPNYDPKDYKVPDE
ncbi:MAG: hypothetical protein R2827_01815 [Bdellovibrionales bacterium]